MMGEAHIWRTAWGATMALLALAFAGAYVTKDMGLLSLIPPATEATPNPAPDVAEGDTLSLYQSAYTAWAALLLLIPAYLFIWTKPRTWLAFWSVSYVAYLIHLAVSMFVFFDGDFAAMTSSSRVSAFWPGMVIVIWWGLDAALALKGVQGRWVTIQRVIVHVLVFVLFVGGSAVKGELGLVQIMGWALAATGVGALVLWRIRQ